MRSTNGDELQANELIRELNVCHAAKDLKSMQTLLEEGELLQRQLAQLDKEASKSRTQTSQRASVEAQTSQKALLRAQSTQKSTALHEPLLAPPPGLEDVVLLPLLDLWDIVPVFALPPRLE